MSIFLAFQCHARQGYNKIIKKIFYHNTSIFSSRTVKLKSHSNPPKVDAVPTIDDSTASIAAFNWYFQLNV